MPGKTISYLNGLAVRTGLYPVAVAVCAGAIFVLSVIPGFGGGLNSGFPAHATAYCVLSLTLILYLRSRAVPGLCAWAVVLAGGFGACIEGIQFLIPYRAFAWVDIVVNVCAAGVAVLPGWIMIRFGWI
jgi:hypothetical protein